MRAGQRLLLPPDLPPMSGVGRVALHSLFRILCEANQLSVGDVVSGLKAPISGCRPSRSRTLVKDVHLIDAGSVQSQRLVTFLESVTSLEGLMKLTLHQLRNVKGVGAIAVQVRQKWCPHCYYEDAAAGQVPYDRLLWSVELVKYCSNHNALLVTSCHHCGMSRTALVGRDISGFCPKCVAWLGRKSRATEGQDDDLARHGKWTARSIADLLSNAPEANTDVSPLIRQSIMKLATLHHGGKCSHLARQIGRNKSVVASWLSGKANPSVDALCDISYVYQQPLPLLLVGKVAEITVHEAKVLPSSVRPRQGMRRKSPQSRDLATIEAFLDSVAGGRHQSISSLQGAARWLGVGVRELYRTVPVAAKRTASALKERSAMKRLETELQRRRKLENNVLAVSRRFAEAGMLPTRRQAHDEMARLGSSVRWSESKEVLARIQDLATAARSDFPALHEHKPDSGN